MRNMQLFYRLLAMTLAFFLLTGTACADEPPAETAPTVTTAAPETEPPLAERLGEYTIVRPERASESFLNVVMHFRLGIKDALGVEMAITTDWVKRGEDPDAAGERELLFGLTNRLCVVPRC